MKRYLSGNEAIARGAFEAGVGLGAAYPGTPSTEILETVADQYRSIYCEWSPNEKVAFEVAIGGSLGGSRSMVVMKHVGLNVAADPLMTFAYTGVNAGFVIICADDPEIHSSQNEQDNRNYAKFAGIPMLEPSDAQEAKDMVGIAFEISERFDTPVMLRLTTRISHSKGLVEIGEPVTIERKEYNHNIPKNVMIPVHARSKHEALLARLQKLRDYVEDSPLIREERNGTGLGIITGGIAYQYVKEVIPDADILKLGIGYPLPLKKIADFAASHKRTLIIEELEPFYEENIRVAGISGVEGKEFTGHTGELSPERVSRALEKAGIIEAEPRATFQPAKVFPRPPILCPGCPHRGVFMALKKLKVTVTGDIGCYTIGALAPLEALHSCICMGASIGNAIGMEKVIEDDIGVVAILGDSTFLHSGITGLLDAVYNRSNIVTIILDNRITAMTGGQEHPGTGYTLMGQETKKVDFIALSKALGVDSIRTVDPYNYEETLAAIKEETKRPGPSVIIADRPCVLMPKRVSDTSYEVDLELCNGCSACFRIGCPVIMVSEERTKRNQPKAEIDGSLCTGCDLCAQICKPEAIFKKTI